MSADAAMSGKAMHALMTRLFPICRSLTGPGVRETLAILNEVHPLTVGEIASGTEVFDWTVPDEWTVRDAFVADADGNRVIDFKACNLHVVGYSEPVDAEMSLEDLLPRLHVHDALPDAIPYRTSYYNRTWGFCLSKTQRDALKPGRYRVRIDSTLEPGVLNWGEIVLAGETDAEVLLSTNICHPSMANNELSGPVTVIALARWLASAPRRHTYRLLFLPETIGAIAYLSRHAAHMKAKTVAGYQVVCTGGPGGFSYLEPRDAGSLTDRAARHALRFVDEPVRHFAFPRCASDERQYNSPGIDLPVGSVMREKYHEYPAYHTSLDDLAFVRPEHMAASLDVYRRCIETIEANGVYRSTLDGCEPRLGKYGLYPSLGGESHTDLDANTLVALMHYANGRYDLIDVADRLDVPVATLMPSVRTLIEAGLLERCP